MSFSKVSVCLLSACLPALQMYELFGKFGAIRQIRM
jgi:hypothetical protein